MAKTASRRRSKNATQLLKSNILRRRNVAIGLAALVVGIFVFSGSYVYRSFHASADNNWEIKSADSGNYCMELNGTQQNDGAIIRTASCDGRAAEHFYWGSPDTTKLHWDSYWCIQPQYGGTAPDTPIVLSACQSGRLGQDWHIHDLPGTPYGEYRNDNAYTANNHSMCLTIPSGNTGAQLQIRTCGGTTDTGYSDQMWHQQFNGDTSGGTGNCRNPLRDVSGLSAGRIDGGVDYGGSGPVYAACPGTIKEVSGSGWPGGIYIAQTIESGSTGSAMADSERIYVAESCNPNVGVGQHVTTSTVICHMFNGPYGIETGWSYWALDQTPLSYQYGGSGRCGSTALGTNYSQFLHRSLGAPAGYPQGSCGYLPSGWPSW